MVALEWVRVDPSLHALNKKDVAYVMFTILMLNKFKPPSPSCRTVHVKIKDSCVWSLVRRLDDLLGWWEASGVLEFVG